MDEKYLVRHLMTNKVTVANTNNTFSQLLGFFETFNILHIPVTENDIVLGVISYSDVLHCINKKLINGESISNASLDHDLKVSDIMTKDIISVKSEDTLVHVIEVLAKEDLRSLLVIDNGTINGVISSKDLVRAFYKINNPKEQVFDINTPGFGI